MPGRVFFIIYATLSSINTRPEIAGSVFTVLEHFGAYAVLGFLFHLAYRRHLTFVKVRSYWSCCKTWHPTTIVRCDREPIWRRSWSGVGRYFRIILHAQGRSTPAGLACDLVAVVRGTPLRLYCRLRHPSAVTLKIKRAFGNQFRTILGIKLVDHQLTEFLGLKMVIRS